MKTTNIFRNELNKEEQDLRLSLGLPTEAGEYLKIERELYNIFTNLYDKRESLGGFDKNIPLEVLKLIENKDDFEVFQARGKEQYALVKIYRVYYVYDSNYKTIKEHLTREEAHKMKNDGECYNFSYNESLWLVATWGDVKIDMRNMREYALDHVVSEFKRSKMIEYNII